MATITTQQIIDGLVDPTQYWAGATITWSLPATGSAWPGYGPGEEQDVAGYGFLTAGQAAYLRQAITAWDGLIAPSFPETSDLANPGAIRVAFTNADAFAPNAVAYAYGPPNLGGTGSTWAGDIWLDDDTRNMAFTPGTDEFHTFLHEFGHAIGLNHPFEGPHPLSGEWENMRYTVMSYDRPTDSLQVTFAATPGGGLQATLTPIFPSTPMLLDVIAIQSRYGADLTTALGGDTYSFSPTAAFFSTLYDAGGVDTIDLANLTRGSRVDLHAGAYSSINYFATDAQAAYWKALFPGFNAYINGNVLPSTTYTWTDNFAIAPGTVIEQLRGSVGADTVVGNDAGDSIWGGAGDDRVTAGAGKNFLRGEEGDDFIQGGADTDDSHGNMGNDTVQGGGGDDWVVGGKDNDALYGETGGDVVWGNLGSDTCDGGDGADQVRGGQGDDIVRGGAGGDWLSGDRGTDTITGGAGADIFHTFEGAGIDRVTDFNAAEGDRVYLLPGTQYSVAQVGADTVVTIPGLDGNQLTLVGVQMSTLTTGWIFGA